MLSRESATSTAARTASRAACSGATARPCLLTGSPPWIDYLAFRDHLRTHPKSAAEYAALKRELAEAHGRDRVGYTDAKTDFVHACLEAARG